jgi:hypothetical protein
MAMTRAPSNGGEAPCGAGGGPQALPERLAAMASMKRAGPAAWLAGAGRGSKT